MRAFCRPDSIDLDTATTRSGNGFIIYDSAAVETPAAAWFDPSWWQEHGRVIDRAGGRGGAWYVADEAGEFVLRRYLRGGLPARVIRDRYLFTGYRRSRSIREFLLLKALHEAGFPVPEPVAAGCWRHGMLCRAALISKRIPRTSTLADRLYAGAMDGGAWAAVGHCLGRFHRAGIVHADLNTANILLDDSGCVFLVDFDRGRWLTGGGALDRAPFRGNISRLRRSIGKLRGNTQGRPGTDGQALGEGWNRLMGAYRGQDD